jgi:Fe-S cluster assembly protein SufD
MSKIEFDKMDIVDWYVSNFKTFENNLNGNRDIPFHKIRQSAIAKFSELGFPNSKNEEWKYTSIKPLLKHEFKFEKKPFGLSDKTLSGFVFDGLGNNLIVFINGIFSQELSTCKPAQKGVIVENLEAAFSKRPDLISKHIAHYADYHSEVFTALNTAFATDGVFIYVPAGTILEQPIHLLNLTDADHADTISNPRNLIIVENDSQVQFIETHNHIGEGAYFTNTVSEVILGERAVMDNIVIQDESTESYHIVNKEVHQQKNSIFTSVHVDLGGAIVRNNLNIRLKGEYCESHLFGFYLGRGAQHIDSHTVIDHIAPNCNSNELFKGILDDKAKGVFNGKVYVRRDAQKTNAFQENKTLVLTDDASMNAKPQLEIFADDVKCSHGATVGQLDDEALFYLRSRGIDKEKANAILQYAFANDIFSQIKIEPVKNWLDAILHERLSKTTAAGD